MLTNETESVCPESLVQTDNHLICYCFAYSASVAIHPPSRHGSAFWRFPGTSAEVWDCRALPVANPLKRVFFLVFFLNRILSLQHTAALSTARLHGCTAYQFRSSAHAPSAPWQARTRTRKKQPVKHCKHCASAKTYVAQRVNMLHLLWHAVR